MESQSKTKKTLKKKKKKKTLKQINKERADANRQHNAAGMDAQYARLMTIHASHGIQGVREAMIAYIANDGRCPCCPYYQVSENARWYNLRRHLYTIHGPHVKDHQDEVYLYTIAKKLVDDPHAWFVPLCADATKNHARSSQGPGGADKDRFYSEVERPTPTMSHHPANDLLLSEVILARQLMAKINVAIPADLTAVMAQNDAVFPNLRDEVLSHGTSGNVGGRPEGASTSGKKRLAPTMVSPSAATRPSGAFKIQDNAVDEADGHRNVRGMKAGLLPTYSADEIDKARGQVLITLGRGPDKHLSFVV